MPRIAILGANGQVGAELCLLFSRDPAVDLVAVCRNRSGSAYLRWMGVRCRHGRAAHEEEAPALFGDCDVIVNSALASGSPAAMRLAEDAIVRNAFRHSPPHARIIHFSTQSVYGDAQPGRLIRWRSFYGQAKLATERCVFSEARRSRKSAHILRLGHVGGALQDISNNIRYEIRERRVVLPHTDTASNLVYTATIVDAIVAIVRGGIAPGCYDLMNVPQWTWRKVYEFEADQLGVELCATMVPTPTAVPALRRFIAAGACAVSDFAGGSVVRQMVATSLTRLPGRLSARAEAWWYCKRAGTELTALAQRRAPLQHLSWVANGKRFLPGLPKTIDALTRDPKTDFPSRRGFAWAEDLPLAVVGSPAVPQCVSTHCEHKQL
jgi:nucleoside-diphosphate-sugar epimerase